VAVVPLAPVPVRLRRTNLSLLLFREEFLWPWFRLRLWLYVSEGQI